MLQPPSDQPSRGDFFSRCTKCRKRWASRQLFLDDVEVVLNGYQANLDNLKGGWFIFTHQSQSCKSSFAIEAGEFFDLYDGPAFEENKFGTDECPDYCLYEDILDPCPALCECAFVREIIQMIQQKKTSNVT